jgi:hypothetical protein
MCDEFSYPRLKPPSYFCDHENENGLILNYCTKRNFLLWYTVGQIIEIGKIFYYTDVKIELLRQEFDSDEIHYVLQLNFDNRAFKNLHKRDLSSGKRRNDITSQMHLLPLSAKIFLQIFPFSVVFDENLVIKSIGNCLQVSQSKWINRHYLLLQQFARFLLKYSNSKLFVFHIKVVCPHIIGGSMKTVFELVKPKIAFNWLSVSIT